MSGWAGLTREEVEALAADYFTTLKKVHSLAHEKYPDDIHDAEQLFQRAAQNVRNNLMADLRERGCPAEEVDGWMTMIMKATEHDTGNFRWFL